MSIPITPSDDEYSADEMQTATAGPGEYLAMTVDKSDHEDMLEAKAILEGPHHNEDISAILEEFPSATAGAGAYLALTAEHTTHHGESANPAQ